MNRILLVDDEELTLEHTRTLLEHCMPECKVIGTASNGKEGIEAIRRLKPDIVITDVVMPGASGLDMIDATLGTCDCRFIILSGYQEFEYVRHAMRSGVVDYLTKPITDSDLREVMGRILGDNQRNESFESQYGHVVAQVIRSIENHYADADFSLGWVCENELFMNSTYTSRLFQKRTGQKFTAWLTDKRLSEARRLLELDRDMTVTEAAERTGFSSSKYFTEVFHRKYGMLPTQYRNKK